MFDRRQLSAALGHPLAALGLPTLLGLAVCVVALGWRLDHTALKQELVASDLVARAAETARLGVRRDSAAVRVVHDSVTVTRTRTAYQTVRDTLILQPVTRADTVSALDQLPVFARTADSAIAACSEFQVSCARYRQVSDSLVVSLKDEREALQKRIRQLEPSGFRKFLRQATPFVAFVGGAYLGARAVR